MRKMEQMSKYRRAYLVIEGTRAQIEQHRYQGDTTPQSLLATLVCLEVRLGIHVIWGVNPQQSARRVEEFVKQFIGGITKDAKRLGK